MPIFGYFWVFCPKSAAGWKLGFATIPEKLPGHLGIPIYHTNHIWSYLSSLERCIRGCSEIQDYRGVGIVGRGWKILKKD